MKKFLILFSALLILFSVNTYAQGTGTAMTTTNGGTLDTCSNAGSLTKTTTLQVNGYQKVVSLQINITKISGTVGGTATPQGSLDGVNYYNITGQTALTLTDVASQGQIWSITDPGFLYYRVNVVGSGTMSASINGFLIARKVYR